jgi:CheY-like chemotaxis protein
MTVDLCESGAEAIAAVKLRQYDLILMDHLMPTMTGAEATAAIREISDARTDCANVPIVALTANLGHGAMQIFRQSGIDDFLSKPMVAAELHTLLENRIPKGKQKPADTTAAPQDNGHDRYRQRYLDTARSTSSALRKATLAQDMKNCNVYVHALGGILEALGESTLSAKAKQLEKAYAEEPAVAFLEDLDNFLNPKPPPTATEIKMKKILLIDDTDAYLHILDDILSGDYETMSSLSGEDGLETAALTMPDLILLDMVMPDLSGMEVIEALKADAKLAHIPVILMSASEPSNIGKADGFIKKPFSPAAVKNKIISILKEGTSQ